MALPLSLMRGILLLAFTFLSLLSEFHCSNFMVHKNERSVLIASFRADSAIYTTWHQLGWVDPIDLEDKRKKRTDDKEVPYCVTERKAKEYNLVIAFDLLLNTCMDIGIV